MEQVLELLRRHIPSAPLYRQAGWSEAELNPAVPILQLSVAFGFVVFVVERVLDFRQLARYKEGADASLPDRRIPLETFFKSLDYGADKLGFGMVSSTIRMVLELSLVFLGWLPYAWDLGARCLDHFSLLGPQSSAIYKESLLTVAFFTILTLQGTLVDIPFSLYSIFVIEERHGFNKNTLPLFLKDTLLTVLLTMVIGSPVIAGIIYLARWGGPQYYVYVWGFMFVFQLFLMTIYPEYIAPLFNKFSPLDPVTHGDLKAKIEELAARVKFPLTKLFVVDGSRRSSHSNAYMYGFGKNKRIVLFDTLLKQVTTEEIVAILGHEIGHWALWHTIQGFVIAQVGSCEKTASTLRASE